MRSAFTSFMIAALLGCFVCTRADAKERHQFGADLRAFYFNGNRDDRQDREAFALGGIFSYTSPPYRGFGGKAAFYTSHDLLHRGSASVPRISNGVIVDDTSNIGGNSELVRSDGSGIDTLGELYLEFHAGHTLLRFGRQRLDTPLVNDYYNRFLPNSFEALLLRNRDLPDTVIHAAVIDRWKYKAEEDFKEIAEGVGLHSNLYIVGMVNTGMPHNTVEGWFYRLDDAFDTLYLLLRHQGQAASDDWSLDGAFQYLRQDDSGDALLGALNTWLAGAKISLSDGTLTWTVMADQVGNDTIRGSGTDYADLGWSKFINFTDIQIDGESLNAGAFSCGTVLEYRVTPHYKAALKYVRIDQNHRKQLASVTPNKRPDSDEYNLDMTYHADRLGNIRFRLGRIDYATDPLITNAYDEVNIRLIYDIALRR